MCFNLWNEVQKIASDRGVAFGLSIPCFEFWLLLHIAGFTTRLGFVDGSAAKRAVRNALRRDPSTRATEAKEVISSKIAPMARCGGLSGMRAATPRRGCNAKPGQPLRGAGWAR